MTGLRYLALVSDAFGGFGGIAQYNRDFLTALSASKACAEIVVLPRLAAPAAAAPPRASRIRQLAPRPRRASYSLAAFRTARGLGPFDAVFCGHLLMAPLAALIARRMRARLWLQVHGVDAWDQPSRQVGWAAAQAGLVTSVSRFTRARMISTWWHGDPASVRVLPNTVGDHFRPGPKPASLAARYGLAGRKVLLTLARINVADRYKGHERVIAALPRIREREPRTAYVIAGDGDDAPRLRALAATLGLSEHIRFVGRIPEEEIADHYRLADAFIMPSTKEGFGIVFLEAAACGTPVIGGNADGSWDALREGTLGEAIDPGDIEAIASAVCAALARGRSIDASAVRVFAKANFTRHVCELAEAFVGCPPLPGRRPSVGAGGASFAC